MHCCIQEKSSFNKFYYLLAQRLCRYNTQSFKYSLKYTFWDYVKRIEKYDIRQIGNLAKLYGHLMGSLDCGIDFLKVVDFSEGLAELSRPTLLLLFIVFDTILTQ